MNTINNTMNTDTVTQSASDNKTSYTTHKKWLFVALAAATLTLSACDRKDESTIEEAEAQAAVASEPMNSNREESAIMPSEDMPENTGAVSEDGTIVSEDMSNDQVGINRTGDSEVLDGSETEEDVSSY
ncbi:hypothetical protein [Psychrobacter urativorans]|uniref:hypothetical protein n=1 Tax=Psychrobacter urativorans TaxID=45610 RepID=UPI001918EA70|nr:hypothetical protein [Psychrobacter urativorans]